MTTALAIRDEQHYLATVRDMRALAERLESVQDAKSLADRAAAAKVWAQRASLGTEQVNLAAAAKLWAERRAGELLRDAIPHGGGRPETLTPRQRLVDIGVTEKQSSRWQKLAAIPADDFTEAVEQAREEGVVSSARVAAIADRQFKQQVQDEFFPAPTPVFDAFWKACGLLMQKARPDELAAEIWDAREHEMVRQWVPLMIDRLRELETFATPVLHAIEGGADAHH